MTADLLFAIIHYAGAFVLFGALFAQAALLMTGVGPGKTSCARLARMDIVFGASAAVVLIGGLLRVFMGVRGADYYFANPAFHLKLGLFIAIALISIMPTIVFIRWRRAEKADPGFAPVPESVKRVKILVHIELTLLALLVVTASIMARWFGL